MDNTLKIIIEGDATGLTSQLKKAGNTITQFVGSMNRQEVDWTSILSKTISPAIISGIAATFATALMEAVNFQNSMTEAANTSTTAFQASSGAISSSALAIQAATGQSAGGVASAMGYASQALGNTTDATNLVAEASRYALSTGIPLMTLVQSFIPVLQEWGITGAQVIPTIDKLFGSAAQGKIAIEDLLKSMANTGSMLVGKVSIDNAAASLEALSKEAGLTVPNAMAIFQKTAEASFGDIQAIAGLQTMGVNMGILNKAINSGDMAGALTAVDKSFIGIAGNAGKIAIASQAMGFSDSQLANISSAAKQFDIINKDTLAIQTNQKAEGEYIKGNLSNIDKIKQAWGSILTDLTGVGNALTDLLTKGIGGVDSSIKGAQGLFGGGGFSAGDFLSALGTNLMNITPAHILSSLLGGLLSPQGSSTTNNSSSNHVVVVSPGGATTPGTAASIPSSAKPYLASQGILTSH